MNKIAYYKFGSLALIAIIIASSITTFSQTILSLPAFKAYAQVRTWFFEPCESGLERNNALACVPALGEPPCSPNQFRNAAGSCVRIPPLGECPTGLERNWVQLTCVNPPLETPCPFGQFRSIEGTCSAPVDTSACPLGRERNDAGMCVFPPRFEACPPERYRVAATHGCALFPNTGPCLLAHEERDIRGRCVSNIGALGSYYGTPRCPPGTYRELGLSISNIFPFGQCVTPNSDPCPDGQERNILASCVSIAFRPPCAPLQDGSGTYRNHLGSCQANPPHLVEGCPPDQERDYFGDCVPVRSIKWVCVFGYFRNDAGECQQLEAPTRLPPPPEMLEVPPGTGQPPRPPAPAEIDPSERTAGPPAPTPGPPAPTPAPEVPPEVTPPAPAEVTPPGPAEVTPGTCDDPSYAEANPEDCIVTESAEAQGTCPDGSPIPPSGVCGPPPPPPGNVAEPRPEVCPSGTTGTPPKCTEVTGTVGSGGCPEGTGSDPDSGECVETEDLEQEPEPEPEPDADDEGTTEPEQEPEPDADDEGTTEPEQEPEPDADDEGTTESIPSIATTTTGSNQTANVTVRQIPSNISASQTPANTTTAIDLNDTASIPALTNQTINVNQTNSTDVGTTESVPSIQDRRHAPS